MTNVRWPDNIRARHRELYDGRPKLSFRTIGQIIEREFGRPMSRDASKTLAKRYGYPKRQKDDLWPDEVKVRHRELIRAGYTHSEVAARISREFGRTMTRSASVSMSHRYGHAAVETRSGVTLVDSVGTVFNSKR